MRIYTENDAIAKWFENNTTSIVNYFDMSVLDNYCFYVIQVKITWYDIRVLLRLTKPVVGEENIPF